MNATTTPGLKKAQIKLVYLVYVLSVVKFIFPYIIQNSAYEPHRDEFLYLAEARHLAWGYYEVPPVLSAMGWLTNLVGGGFFWIKFWPSIFGALTFVIVARLIISFGGRWFALVLGFLPFVLGYYVHVHFMFQPNFLEMFFWTLMAYGLIKYVKTGANSGLYLTGIALGLGMLSKYSVSFFAVSLAVGLLLTAERKIWRNKHFYLAILIGIAIFSPNLIWEWAHGLPFLEQMKELKKEQLQYVSQLWFLTDQIIFNLPCIFIWISGLYWVAFNAAGRPYRFIGWAFLLAIAIIVVGHGKGYYGMPAYPVLFGFGAVSLERWTSGRLNYLRYGLVGFALITGCYLDTVTLPFLPPPQLAAYYARNPLFKKLGFLKWEDTKNHPLPQDFADMLSWQEMTQKVAKVYHSLDGSSQSKTIIDGDNYGECSAVDYFALPYHLKPTMGHAASYLFWTPANFYKNDIYILISDYRGEIHEDYIKEFRYAVVVDSISNPYAREFGSYIILLKDPNDKFRKVWKDDYESQRNDQSWFH